MRSLADKKSLHSTQQIRLDILDIFKPDRHPDQAIRDTGFGTLFGRQATVGGGSRMGDGGFGVTEVGGDREHTGGIDQRPAFRLAAIKLKRPQATELALLLFRQFMLRMAGKAGIVDAFYLRLLLQPGRQLQRRRLF